MWPDRVSNPGPLTYNRVRCPTDCATRPGLRCTNTPLSPAVLQVRKDKRDDLGIIFLTTSFKLMLNRLSEMVLMRGHSVCFY